MIAGRLADALNDDVALVIAGADSPIEAILDILRAAVAKARESVLLVIGHDVTAINRAMLRAAIGALAIEAAPASRVNALDVDLGARVEDVVAAAMFLAEANSTTGQVIEIVS